jgi:cytochrome P450
MDPQVYENPEKFDAWRYLKMRQRPGEENQHQFATTSPENMGFGHGMHACPGRFFASNEIKILMCLLLLKYDWRYGDEQKEMLPPLCVEHVLMVDPRNKLQCRERVPEIDLLNPTA